MGSVEAVANYYYKDKRNIFFSARLKWSQWSEIFAAFYSFIKETSFVIWSSVGIVYILFIWYVTNFHESVKDRNKTIICEIKY